MKKLHYDPDWNGARTESWGSEALNQCGGSLLLWLTKIRPGVAPSEAISVMRNEGYEIDEETYTVTKSKERDCIDDLKAPDPAPKPVYKGKFKWWLWNVTRGGWLLIINEHDHRSICGSRLEAYKQVVSILNKEYHRNARIEEDKTFLVRKRDDGSKYMIPIIKYYIVD